MMYSISYERDHTSCRLLACSLARSLTYRDQDNTRPARVPRAFAWLRARTHEPSSAIIPKLLYLCVRAGIATSTYCVACSPSQRPTCRASCRSAQSLVDRSSTHASADRPESARVPRRHYHNDCAADPRAIWERPRPRSLVRELGSSSASVSVV